jgi:hypothetical protein
MKNYTQLIYEDLLIIQRKHGINIIAMLCAKLIRTHGYHYWRTLRYELLNMEKQNES